MATKIITSDFQRDGYSVKVSFNLVDDLFPDVVLDTIQIYLTVKAVDEKQFIEFVAYECLKNVQVWYDECKIKQENDTTIADNKLTIENYINSKLVL